VITEPLVAPAQGHPTHHRWREGAGAGLLAAAAGALWSLIVDVAAGHPFKTWRFLGYGLLNLAGPSGALPSAEAVAAFLVFVAVLFMLLGRLAVGVAHRADAQPSLILLANTILTFVTFALVVFATAFTSSRLGAEAWLQILGSTLIALWTLAIRVYQTHPSLVPDFKRARDE
jgi:hypothetical protein